MMAEPVVDALTPTMAVMEAWAAGSEEAEVILLQRAAAGEGTAQRAIATGLAVFEPDDPAFRPQYMYGSELMARLVAGTGEPFDRRFLAGTLALAAASARNAGDMAGAKAKETECLSILNQLADEGYEEAAEAVNTLAAEFSAEAVSEARGKIVAELVEPGPWMRDWGAPDVTATDRPSPIVCTPPGVSLSPREIVKVRLENTFWAVRFYFSDLGYALCSLGRALVGRF